MKKILLPIFTALFVVFSLASCLKDNEEQVQTANDIAIVSFGIRTGKVVHNTKTSAGTDSTYTTMTDLSRFRFHVDQLEQRIYNTQPLPFGTDVTKLIGAVTTKNNGVVFMKYGNLTDYVLFRPTDSIDCSQPVDVRVYDVLAQNYRSYTLTVNVEKQPENTITWGDKLATNATLGTLENPKMVQLGETLYVFGSDGTTTTIYSTNITDGTAWTQHLVNIGLDADVSQNLAVSNGSVFALSQGMLFKSANILNWNLVSGANISNLLGAHNNVLYALNANGELVASSNEGVTWTTQTLDANKNYLPTQYVSVLNNAGSTMIIGLYADANNANQKHIGIWRQMINENNGVQSTIWTFYGTNTIKGLNPTLAGEIKVQTYGNTLAMVVKNTDAKTQNAQPFVFYISEDGGINWSKSSLLYLPSNLDSQTTNITHFIDNQKMVWIITANAGNVWKGTTTITN